MYTLVGLYNKNTLVWPKVSHTFFTQYNSTVLQIRQLKIINLIKLTAKILENISGVKLQENILFKEI